MKRFTNKVVIVTGAGRGMGQTCGLSFAAEGASVAFVDINAQGIQESVCQARTEGGQAISIICDVAKAADIQRTVEKVVAEFKTVDILVNNAGVLRTTTPLEKITEDEWDLIIDVNLKSVFLFSRAVLPIMRAKKYGKIVNIASSAAAPVNWGERITRHLRRGFSV